MPFILRQVTPVRLSRLPNDGSSTTNSLEVDPRQSISNQTLSACLRQLASLVTLASDIFTHCQDEASVLHQRTVQLRQRLDRLQSNADKLDSRSAPIPQGDLAVFSHDHKTNHFQSCNPVADSSHPAATTSSQVPELKLFTSSNRPNALTAIYDKAAWLLNPPPVNRPDSLLDELNAADYGRLMALGATLRRRRKQRSNVLEIETRRPASLAHLREWMTDDEGVLDDLSAPVGPDNRRLIDLDHTDSALHRLPSPEEKAKAAASQVFPAEMVRLDVTGSGFQRMTQFRRSLQHFEYADNGAVGAGQIEERIKTRKRSKKKTKKRRNTIACDGDRRDIQDVLAGRANSSHLSRNDGEKCGSRSSLRQRLNLVHLLRTSLMTTPSTGKASGSAVTSSDMSYDESDNTMQSNTTDATSHASSELVVQVTAGNLVTATRTRSGAMMNTISRLRRLGTDHTFVSGPVQVDIHPPPISTSETTQTPNGRESELYELIPSEKEFGTLGTARPVLRGTVKLRASKESTDGRSSSGNWSASGSSCSTRASLDSDHPRHHHGHIAAASPLAQRHPRVIQPQHQQQRSFSPEMDVDSALSGDDCSATTTSSIHRPDENHHNHNELDLETSSVYSCDAEGYYTSFHIDSGLKTLKEAQSDGSLHKNRTNQETTPAQNGTDSNRSSGMSSASGSVSGAAGNPPENEYELFGKGSTLSNTTTSSAGTVIFRPEGAAGNSIRKKRNSQPPEPPPRNGSNRNSTTSTVVSMDSDNGRKPEGASVENSRQLTESESKEIADALKQLRNEDADATFKSEAAEEASRERIRAKTQIERIPAMCVVTPSITPLPSDDDHSPLSLESHIQSTFLQHMAGGDIRQSNPVVRVNVADLPTLPASTETQIVIKASVVKCPVDQELVALNQLPTADNEPSAQPFSSAGSSESSRSSSLERKKRGARVTLDSEGKVVYSSDSLKRRKAQAGHTTFEPGQETRKLDPGTSAFRPNPIGSTTKPLSPPPYRPAPTFTGIRSAVRTQPDGQTAQQEQRSAAGSPASTAVSRSDSYRLANEDEVDNSAGSFQRNRSDSYRKANQSVTPVRLGPLNHPLSGFAVNGRTNGVPMARPMTAGTGQYISGHLTDRQNGWSSDRSRSVSAQPMSYTIKSPMLVKQISSNPGFTAGQLANGQNGRPTRQYPANQQQEQQQFFTRRISSPAMMMTSSPLLVKPSVNPNVAGRRIYGGPRLLVNPKHLQPTSGVVNHNNNKSGSVSSLNSSAGSGLDISISHNKKSNGFNGVPPSPVVRPPTNAQDRPSFFNTPDGAGASRLNGGSSNSPLPGYQSLSPPPRMSALPLAQLSDAEFQRKDFRYNSLPARFKTAADYYASLSGRSSIEPDYSQWLPGTSKSGTKKSEQAAAGGRDSPEEGGFLEFNNNTAGTVRQHRSNSSSSSSSSTGNIQQGSSPTPSFSSCSLDGSFTSSLNESIDVRPGTSWPLVAATGSPHPPGMVVHSIGLVKRTTISDFKRKLLQLHHPGQKKMSAVEQLKATQPPPSGLKGPSPDASPVTKHPALENFIRRSARVSYIASRLSQQQRNNRFQHSPRTDVLSSTIVEGRSEEELAEQADDAVTISSASSGSTSVRRHLSFQQPHRGSSTPSSGSSTPIETSL